MSSYNEKMVQSLFILKKIINYFVILLIFISKIIMKDDFFYMKLNKNDLNGYNTCY